MSHNFTLHMYSFTGCPADKDESSDQRLPGSGQSEGLWCKQLTTVQFIEADKTIYHGRIQICPAIIHHHIHQHHHRRLSTSLAML